MIAQIDGRPVLQPTCNRVPILERCHSLKKISSMSPPLPPLPTPISPNSKSSVPAVLKNGNDHSSGFNPIDDKALTPRCAPKSATLVRSNSKKCSGGDAVNTPFEYSSSSSLNYASSLIVESPGSIAAARREQVTLLQAQRKMKIAHYGRSKSAKFERKVIPIDSPITTTTTASREEKRCSFITPNSGMEITSYLQIFWIQIC